MSASLSSRDEPENNARVVEPSNIRLGDRHESLFGYTHTFLFTIFFAVSYFVANKDALKPTLESLGTILGFNLIVALGLSLFALAIIKSRYMSAFTATLLTILILNVGRIFDFARGTSVANSYGIRVVGIVIFLLLLAGIIALVSLISRKGQSAKKALTKILIIMAAAMVLASTVQLVVGGFSSRIKETNSSFDISKIPNNLPDIYYIVLDGYTREDVLEHLYEFDNSQFLGGLEDRGFYIAEKSFSNYTHSVLSISSTLERRYINEIADVKDTDTANYGAAYDFLKNNRTINELRSVGYNYVNLSTWNFTDDSDNDDVPYDLVEDSKLVLGPVTVGLDAVQLVYLKNTVLNPFIDVSAAGDEAKKIINTINAASNLETIEKPKFVFLHITSPHPPYFFNADGSRNDSALNVHPYFQWPYVAGYIEQTRFINKEVTNLIDNILASHNANNQPVVVLASDHGGLVINDLGETANEPLSGIVERHSNLSAFYFPAKDYSELYPGISPVNYFRVIFNKFLNQQEETLDDRVYYSSGKTYRLEDLTEAVKSYDTANLINWRNYIKPSSKNSTLPWQ